MHCSNQKCYEDSCCGECLENSESKQKTQAETEESETKRLSETKASWYSEPAYG